jgi:transposase InsO family protein
MKDHKERYSVTKMAKALRVSRSGYYAWENRKPSKHTLEDHALAELIAEIFKHHFSRYGSPRIWVELRDNGIWISRKRVQRLMREHKLRARRPQGWVKTTDSNHGLLISENILDRNFYTAFSGEK